MDVVKTRNIWFILSSLVLLAGVISLAVFGLNLGIDFKGGTLLEVKFLENKPEITALEELTTEISTGNTVVQRLGENSFSIRTVELSPEQHDTLKLHLIEQYGQIEERLFNKIGPVLSREITKRAGYQLVLVIFGILVYIAWAFRRVPKPLSSWRFGWAAIVALIHDLLVVIGVFAVLGRFLNVEINALFVTALLTVLGFSVHDTIIVFDRIRENLRRLAHARFEEIINRSINQTLVRSINTSTTVIFVLIALLLFGGESIRYFTLALLVGIVAGTYSSIFLATPLLYVSHRKRFSR